MADDPDALTPEETAALAAPTPVADVPVAGGVAPEAPVTPAPPEPVAATPEPAPPPPPAEPPLVERAQKMVPLAALAEQRRKTQELEARLQQLTEQLTPKPQIPTLHDDPATNLDTRIRQLEQVTGQTVEQTRQQQQIANLQSAYQAHEAEFVATTPDYTDAAAHLVNQRAAELAAAGLSPEETQQVIVSDLRAITARALNAGVNPAERIYAIAKARGFATKTAAPVAAPPPAAPINPVAALQAAQLAANPLAAAGGATPTALTVEAIAGMSEDEIANLNPREWRRVMGG